MPDFRARLRSEPELFLYYELAWNLGCTVDELLNRMSSAELTGWKAFLKYRADEMEKRKKR